MTDALITDLAQIKALRVISRTSVIPYRRTGKSMRSIADELGVDAVVEGTVARSGNRVRITAQLIHAATDRHLWARSYERDLRDVLVLQAEVAGAIAQAVQVELQPEEQRRLAKNAPVEPRRVRRLSQGPLLLEQALARGDGEGQGVLRAGDRRGPHLRARLFRAGGRLQPVRNTGSGSTRMHAEGRSRGAQGAGPRRGRWPRLTRRWPASSTVTTGTGRARRRSSSGASSWTPTTPEGHRAYAIFLLTVRRPEEALAEARRARDLSPLTTVVNVELGAALVRVGRHDDAIHLLQQDPGDRSRVRAHSRHARLRAHGTGRLASSHRGVREGGGPLTSYGPCLARICLCA